MLFIFHFIVFKDLKMFAMCMLYTLAVKHASIRGWMVEQLLMNLFSENQNLKYFLLLMEVQYSSYDCPEDTSLHAENKKNNNITPLRSPCILSVLFIHFVSFGAQCLQAQNFLGSLPSLLPFCVFFRQ